MYYYIAIEVDGIEDMTMLVAALRHAYDMGTAGDFQVLPTHSSTFMIVFRRNTVEDRGDVIQRAARGSLSIENAAMKQLAEELKDGEFDFFELSIINNLRNGNAKVFDFAFGAIKSMAEVEAEHADQLDPFDSTKMSPAWSDEHENAAFLEGWIISCSHGSEYGPWQIQKIDDASVFPGATQLKSDDCAWKIVLNGVAEHHIAALKFIQAHNPKEIDLIKKSVASSSDQPSL